MTNEELREVGRKAYASAEHAGLKYSQRKLVETAAIVQAYREDLSGGVIAERDKALADLAKCKREYAELADAITVEYSGPEDLIEQAVKLRVARNLNWLEGMGQPFEEPLSFEKLIDLKVMCKIKKVIEEGRVAVEEHNSKGLK